MSITTYGTWGLEAKLEDGSTVQVVSSTEGHLSVSYVNPQGTAAQDLALDGTVVNEECFY